VTQRGRIPMTYARARTWALVMPICLLAACGPAADASPTQLAAQASEQPATSPEPSARPTDAPSDPGLPQEPIPCPDGVLCQGRIGPGDYAAVVGLAGVKFAVQSEWDADVHPEAGFVSLFNAGDVPAIVGVSDMAGDVFSDPCDDQTTQSLERTPQAMVDWLAGHPSVEMSEPEPVTLGEAVGLRVELTTTKAEPCAASTGITEEILLWPQGPGGVFLTVDGTTAIFYVVTIGEQLVVVSAETIGEVEPWRALVEPVLESIELVWLTQLRDETALADCVRAFPCRLAAGEHHTEALATTPITLTLEAGWTALVSQSAPSVVLLTGDPAPAAISAFTTTGEVFTDPCSLEETTTLETTVDAVVEWLVDHPHLGASDPEAVTVGGLTGQWVSLEPTHPGCSGTELDPIEVPLFRLADDLHSAFGGLVTTLFVLEAGGEILILSASAPEGGSGMRKVETIFDSMDLTAD